MKDDSHPNERLSASLGSRAGAVPKSSAGKPWRGVFFNGPHPDQDAEGEEIPVWFVYIWDEEAEPTGKVYRCLSFGPAQELARRMAEDRDLELIHEALTA